MSTELAIALIALGGVLVGQLIVLYNAMLDRRRAYREETFRSIRWAAEQAAQESDTHKRMGLAALAAIDQPGSVSAEDEAFINAILATMALPDERAYTEYDVDQVIEEGDHE